MINNIQFSIYRDFSILPEKSKGTWRPPPLIKNKIARHILAALAIGGAGALVTASGPAALAIMVQGIVIMTLRKVDFKREAARLQKKGYVALTKSPEGWTVRLLKKSKKRMDQIAFEDLMLPREEKWDRKWRILIFDVPEKDKISRDLLRQKLKILGMYNFQRSTFAYPYGCRRELALVADHYGLARHMTYLETNFIDIDHDLRRFFSLR